MTKNKEKLVKVEAVCTSMTGEFRDTNEDNFYFNGQYMDSDGGIALRLTSGEPEEVEPEEEELSEEMLQIIEESYREAEENGEIPDFDDFDVMKIEFTKTAEPYNRIVLNYFSLSDVVDFTMNRRDMM